jgi:hypothetical protein
MTYLAVNKWGSSNPMSQFMIAVFPSSCSIYGGLSFNEESKRKEIFVPCLVLL